MDSKTLYLKALQTDSTLLANNTQHCWAQHVASLCMEPQQCWHLLALVAHSLKPAKLLVPCKRKQHCWPKTPNNTQQCCDLLRRFAWALKLLEITILYILYNKIFIKLWDLEILPCRDIKALPLNYLDHDLVKYPKSRSSPFLGLGYFLSMFLNFGHHSN